MRALCQKPAGRGPAGRRCVLVRARTATFLKTAGPPRLGVTDRSLSFATNGHGGVCLTFERPVAGIEPTGRLTHPSLTLTVADLDGFVAALRQPVDEARDRPDRAR